MQKYSQACLEGFLKNQGKLFDEPVAETPEEAAELTEFFKAAHDYGEMELTYAPDSNGVTVLAKPMSTTQRAQYLDQKLAAFTSQF